MARVGRGRDGLQRPRCRLHLQHQRQQPTRRTASRPSAQWARDYWSALAPHHAGVYVNFLMEEGDKRIEQAYGAAKYERLRALKRAYDPTNLFRLNQNIRPD